MIVLNGGSYYPESECLDNEWIKHIGNDDLIGFIPSATTRSEKTYFEFFKEKMRNYNLTNIVMVDLYNDWSVVRETKVIYIAGGNTYKLLEIMNVSGFTNYIKDNYMKKIIIGNSAGAVVLGKDIMSSNSQDIIGLSNTKGVNLVDFSICPHYTIEKDLRLESISEKLKHKVVGIPETSGIIINNGDEKHINEIITFQYR